MPDFRQFASTSNTIRFTLKDKSTGLGLTGLTFSSSGLIISTIADIEAAPTVYTQAGSTIETIATLGTFATPTATKCRFKAVDATNHPGLYEFQFDNNRFSVSSARRLIVSVNNGGSSVLDADYEIELVAFNPFDAVRLGLSALPNVGAGLLGGLPTSSVRAATAQAGTFATIKLDASASVTNSLYNGMTIVLTGGAGAGQARTITAYNGTSKQANVDRNFTTAPDNTTTFVIVGTDNPALNASLQVTNAATTVVIRTGTAQAGSTANTIKLDSGASATNNLYSGDIVTITSGTGAGQTRLIVAYNGTTKVATVASAWNTTPTNTSVFNVLASTTPATFSAQGVATAASASTLTLDNAASATNDIYNGSILTILSGTDAGDTVEITAYNGTTKVATVTPNFAVTPDTTSAYAVIPTLGTDATVVQPVTYPVNFAALAIAADGGVTLADGVAHGGTPGSSTATLAMQAVNVTNPSGTAIEVSATGAYAINIDSDANPGVRFGCVTQFDKALLCQAGLYLSGGVGGPGGLVISANASGPALSIFGPYTTPGPVILIDATVGVTGVDGGPGIQINTGAGDGVQINAGGNFSALHLAAAGTAAAMNVTNSGGSAIAAHSTGGSGIGIDALGNGNQPGIRGKGGDTGHGIQGLGGATNGDGMYLGALSTAGIGLEIVGGGYGISVFGYKNTGVPNGAAVHLETDGDGGEASDTVVIVGTIPGNAIALTPGAGGYGLDGSLSPAALASFFATDSGQTYAGAVAGSVVKETASHATVTGGTITSVSGSVGSVTGNVGGNVVGSVGSVTGAVGSVTAAVTISTAQLLGTPRNISGVADGAMTLNDALWSIVSEMGGRETLVSGTWTKKTPSGATTTRVFTVSPAPTDQSRT